MYWILDPTQINYMILDPTQDNYLILDLLTINGFLLIQDDLVSSATATMTSSFADAKLLFSVYSADSLISNSYATCFLETPTANCTLSDL